MVDSSSNSMFGVAGTGFCALPLRASSFFSQSCEDFLADSSSNSALGIAGTGFCALPFCVSTHL